MAFSSDSQTPARRNPPEIGPVVNELVYRWLKSKGKFMSRIDFLPVFRKYAVTKLRHFVLATLKVYQ